MSTTTLAPVDQAYIEEVVKKAIANMMSSVSSRDRYEMDLRERMVRVEEGLQRQGELMQANFTAMEKRSEQMDKRLEQMDKRLDLMQQDMDKRFERVDKRFDLMQQEIARGFEQNHREIIALHNEMKTQLRWAFGLVLTMAGLVIAVSKMV